MDKRSIYGYKSQSPYRYSPYLDINTPSGEITMEGVPHDILGITPEGETQYMKANSSNPYKFNSSQVREIPLAKRGGTHDSRYLRWKYQRGGSAKELYDYLFEDDEEEESSTVPTAPSADEVEESPQQQAPESDPDYDIAMMIAMEEGPERIRNQRRTTIFNPYPEEAISPAEVNSNAKFAYQYYQQKGIPSHVAAGIVGNLMQESGLNPNASGDNGLATGVAQWHPDRFKGLQGWAQASGKNPFSLQTQLDYVLHESQQRGDFGHLLSTRNSAEAAYVFAKKFERPKVIDSKRIVYAKKLN